LGTWGYRVIATIGSNITEMTPSRGFAAQIATALTIILGSKLGLPISTTHVLVGAVIGVGMARGMAALNLRVIRDVLQSWVITVPFCALLSMLLFGLARLVFA
jgi:phosphate/sulfate permease